MKRSVMGGEGAPATLGGQARQGRRRPRPTWSTRAKRASTCARTGPSRRPRERKNGDDTSAHDAPRVAQRLDGAREEPTRAVSEPKPMTSNRPLDPDPRVRHRTIKVGPVEVFYREAGVPRGPQVDAILVQNGDAYEEGLSPACDPLKTYWRDASIANQEALREALSPEAVRFAYLEGVPDRASSARTRGFTIRSSSIAPAPSRSSSTSSSTIEPMWSGTPHFAPTCAIRSPLSSSCGGAMTPTSRSPAQGPTQKTWRTRTCISSTRGTSRSRPTPPRSHAHHRLPRPQGSTPPGGPPG